MWLSVLNNAKRQCLAASGVVRKVPGLAAGGALQRQGRFKTRRAILAYLHERRLEPCARTVPAAFLAALSFIEKAFVCSSSAAKHGQPADC